MIRPVRSRTLLLLLVACLALGACGKAEAPPGQPEAPAPTDAAELAGTYVLDKEATQAALLKAASALDDEEVAARMNFPQEAETRQRKIQVQQKSRLRLAEAVARGEMDQEFTIVADGTWHGSNRVKDQTRTFSGTWTRKGDELTITQGEPGRHKNRTCRVRDGTLEILDGAGLSVAVLKRKPK